MTAGRARSAHRRTKALALDTLRGTLQCVVVILKPVQTEGEGDLPMLTLRIQKIDLTDGTSGQWFARAHIVARAAEDTFDHGMILLSPDCRCPREIISSADRMIRELEKIKVQASKVKWNSSAARR
jgi:hypothetical protein